MKKCCIAILAGTLLLPALAPAQRSPSLSPARFSITPFVGGRVPFTTQRQERIVVVGDEIPLVAFYDEEQSGGPVAGAEATARVIGPFGLVGSFVYAGAEDYVQTLLESREVSPPRVGPTVYFAKVAASYRLPEPTPDNRRFRPAGFVFAGPALVRENFEGEDAIDNWAVNLGAKAVQSLGRGNLAFQLGVEDYVTFWNIEDRERELVRRFTEDTGRESTADFRYDRGHIVMLTLGLAYRF